MSTRSLALAFLLLLASVPAGAGPVELPTTFADPALQARYEALTRELRCLVCQNQSIADSHALLAADLRREVHGMLAGGASDDEVIAFMTERYGDFVLYAPPVRHSTWLLWFGPALLLLVGGAVLWRTLRARSVLADDAERGE